MNVNEIGTVPWTHRDLLAGLSEFQSIWDQRPIKDNAGGISFQHAYSLYFLAKYFQFETIIESGIWKGQSTWLFEQACPDAKVICLDPGPKSFLVYVSPRAEYRVGPEFKDFAAGGWESLNKETTLLFLDDHYGTERLKQAKAFGIKHCIFEDNFAYWGQGEMCFHPNFMETGVDEEFSPKACLRLGLRDVGFLHDSLEVYYEFPPIIHPLLGEPWYGDTLSKPPLLDWQTAAGWDSSLANTYHWCAYLKLFD
jgi:hypothetical protein